jgi:hypothetical protein
MTTSILPNVFEHAAPRVGIVGWLAIQRHSKGWSLTEWTA